MSSSTITTATVRKAGAADTPRVGDTLAAAFYEDPVMSWCYPDRGRRAEILPAVFRATLEATHHGGGIDTVTDEVAAAIWVPPGTQIDDEKLADEMAHASAEYTERMFVLMQLLDAHHPHDLEHHYLLALGTRPEHQSRGLGSMLLRAVLAGCDQDGVPAYLEATSESSRRLYERHDFAVKETVTLPDGPPLWCMWRPPRQP
ncbi:GNAT family N-acetyltransferase [Phytoactinopolyspora halotolerans]|uniref:GNAT family N-acetyltransferase n=1 Tax=Phytoactinopolyspora halotolerans TaxID=1981512 RepID=A0A6L9SDK8_9ACTN|nr:GNAT family N-acetyltransferase [Phytoactinopolyspora halotolerans]NEE03223.1 GNAT family N-acetyltransferase [Phytoactinopolyspora halotolerans]